MTIRYRYVGDGLGVPGLPHEIESKSGLPEHLKAVLESALEIGTYERVSSGSASSDEDEEDGD